MFSTFRPTSIKFVIEGVHVMPLSSCKFLENQLGKSHTLPLEVNEFMCIPHVLSSLIEIRWKIYSHDVEHLFLGNRQREDCALTFLWTYMLWLPGGGDTSLQLGGVKNSGI